MQFRRAPKPTRVCGFDCGTNIYMYKTHLIHDSTSIRTEEIRRSCRRRGLSRDKHTHEHIRACTCPQVCRGKKGKKKKPCRFQSITHRPVAQVYTSCCRRQRWLRILFTSRCLNPSCVRPLSDTPQSQISPPTLFNTFIRSSAHSTYIRFKFHRCL